MTTEAKVMGWQDYDRINREKRGQSDAARAYDAQLSAAWIAAGGTEDIRQQATGSAEAAACRRDILPGDPIPAVAGAAPAAAVDVICGGGRIAIAYVHLGSRGHAMSRATSGWYHPDHGTVSASRPRRLTLRPYHPTMTAPEEPAVMADPASVCPACGAGLVPRGAKLWCDRCRLPVETCCDGGRNTDTR